MTRALQRAASRTLEQSTPQDPEQQAPALLRAMREVLDAPNAVGAEEEEEPTSPSSLPMQQFSLDVDQPLVSPNGQALIDAMYEALHGVEGGGAATEAGVKRASPEAHSAGMTHGTGTTHGSGSGSGVREAPPAHDPGRAAHAALPSASCNQVWQRRDSGKGWGTGSELAAANSSPAVPTAAARSVSAAAEAPPHPLPHPPPPPPRLSSPATAAAEAGAEAVAAAAEAGAAAAEAGTAAGVAAGVAAPPPQRKWVPLLAACALNQSSMPRVTCMARRKATMVDTTGDGRADLLMLDSTGDGDCDQPVASVAVDTTGDGTIDALIADSNGDGRGDCLVLDTSGDGVPDTAIVGVLVDTDNDGQADVLLVDTTGDGVADTFVHIHGVGEQGGPQHTKPPRRQSAAARQASRGRCAAGGGRGAARGGGGSGTAIPIATATPTPNGAATRNGAATATAYTTDTDTDNDTAITPAPCGTGRGTAQAARGGPPKATGEGKQGWTREEDETIVAMVLAEGQKWSRIAAVLPDRTDDAVRNRYLRLQRKTAELPGAWGGAAGAVVTREDLQASEMAKKGDMWSPEEDATIRDGVHMHGQKWQLIAQQLPGRSANAVRNRYLRCFAQPDGALKSEMKLPRPRGGGADGAAQGRAPGRPGRTNAPLRPTVHAPLQQPRAAGNHPGLQAGLHLMGRAPAQPPPSLGRGAPGHGFSFDELYGEVLTDGAGAAGSAEFDADIQHLLTGRLGP